MDEESIEFRKFVDRTQELKNQEQDLILKKELNEILSNIAKSLAILADKKDLNTSS